MTSKKSFSDIWGEGYRVFLSHKAEVKREAARLKEAMEPFGVTCFVAHADIKPTRAWQDEIENALRSMDAFVALLTKKYHNSKWTDQEVGFAVARNVPIFSVKLEIDPYGFIGKFQALSCDWDEVPVALMNLLIRQPRMLDAYIEALPRCVSFDQGNALAKVLPSIDALSKEQADRLMNIFNQDSQIRGSFGFSGEKPYLYGDGLAAHLTRASGQRYAMNRQGMIERKSR